MDDLANKLLKLIRKEICKSLTLITNQSIYNGIFPEQLKLGWVLPLSTVFERVLQNQIHTHFDRFNSFYSSLYGVRPNHSTELAVLEVVDQILIKMDDKKNSD